LVAGSLERLDRALLAAGLDGCLVTSRPDVRYLSGFTGSNGWLFVQPDRRILLTDSRYVDQAAAEAPAWSVAIAPAGLMAALVATLDGPARVAVDPADVSHAIWQRLPTDVEVEWVPADSAVRALRRRKAHSEVDAIRDALALAEEVLLEWVADLRPGMTELSAAADLEHRCRRRGATAMAFETIIAGGSRGALPHARPTEEPLAVGDRVVVDFGCVVNGYCSDITRSVEIGASSDPAWERIHAAVDEARCAAIAAIEPGVRASCVDATAREVLAGHGLAEYFTHSLGHGVGLDVHEEPRLATSSTDVLEAGMVVTVEPGIYLPERGGIRLEDMVLVTTHGAERLNGLGTDVLRVAEEA